MKLLSRWVTRLPLLSSALTTAGAKEGCHVSLTEPRPVSASVSTPPQAATHITASFVKPAVCSLRIPNKNTIDSVILLKEVVQL